MTHPPITPLAAWLLTAAFAFAGPTLSVKDKAGRSMEIELTSISGEQVIFQRLPDRKSFTLPIATFDADSATRILANKTQLGDAHPNYGIDVVVDKRRKRQGDSYYMVQQTISCKVNLRNPALVPTPPAKARLLYIGENQRTGTQHSILATDQYDFQIAAGATHTKETAPCTTSYDSDNKGYGNIGGDQYEGYLLLLMDGKGNVIQFQTSCAKLNQLLTDKPEFREVYKNISSKVLLDDKFVPTGKS